jgi:hypothetical protein
VARRPTRSTFSAAPDEAVLGTYPTGNALRAHTVYSAPQIIAGDYDNMQAELSATALQGVVDLADGSERPLFDIEQDLRLALSRRGQDFALSGDSRARLRSVGTGAVFTWEPRLTGTVTCSVESASRSDDLVGGCAALQIDCALDGKISGPGGSGTCGSFQQAYSFAMHFEFEQMVYSTQMATTPGGAHGTGGLTINNDRCSNAIFGAMR